MLEAQSRDRGLCIAVLCAALASCGPRGVTADGRARPCAIKLPEKPPELGSVPELSDPQSRIALDVAVDTKRLAQELARRVPTTLATASRRPIGAPGLLSYTVTRGAFAFAVEKQRLRVTTPIRAQVEICKQLGPFCVTYGRCNPQLVATVSVPLVLERDYALAKSGVSIQLTRSCQIMGFDATSHIHEAAERERAQIQRQVDASLPDPRSYVAAAWKLLSVPLALGTAGCLRVEPRRVLQAEPSHEAGQVRTSLAIFGATAVETPCRSEMRPPTTPPAAEISADAPRGIALELPVHIGYNDVSAELSRSLGGASVGGIATIRQVHAHPALVAGKPRLALAVTLGGGVCGQAWLHAEPYFDPAANRVRLRNALVMAPSAALEDADVAAALVDVIEKKSRISLVVDVTLAPPALQSLLESASPGLPEGVTPKLDLAQVQIARVVVGPNALVPVATVTGNARLDVRAL